MSTMIRIQNLTKFYRNFKALDDLSVDIDRGQILGLLGPNGAGKTTTMRILTGYLKATSGSIEVDGLDVERNPVEVKRRIGYLPESAPIYPDMLTYDYLYHVASVRKVPRQARLDRIEELSDLCDLDDVMHKPVKELSRGYTQRVGLAHAMMSDPPVLVLDEPTSGLDPNQIVQIRSIIRKMGEQKTVILSTHILSEAEATCDRIIIINRGRLAADGTPETIGEPGIRSQVVRVVLDLSGASGTPKKEPPSPESQTPKSRATDPKVVRAVLSLVPGVVSVSVNEDQEELSLLVSCEGDRRRELYGAIKTRDWMLLELSLERQSLESTFRELTGNDTESASAEGEKTVEGRSRR